jgi:DNA-binding NarL/FixJ family response regulator
VVKACPTCDHPFVGLSVLIVDDHPVFRASARAMLELEGFDVVGEAADGASAVELARELEPELVLLDVALPDTSGSCRQGRGARRAPEDREPCRRGHANCGRDPLRVVIAEDSVLLREGLARVLAEGGFDVAAQVGDAAELHRAVKRTKPDVAIVDGRMPPTQTDEGARAAEEIREQHPDVGVLVLSQVVEARRALKLFSERPEGFGYLLKDRVLEIDEFLEAVRRVGRGGTAIDPELVAQVIGRRRERDPLDELTPREREVLSLMAEGRSNRAICEKLFLSPKTVETHVNSIFGKLNLPLAPDDHRRVLAVVAFLRAA